jgi:WD40-like Beta Propeller Repeat
MGKALFLFNWKRGCPASTALALLAVLLFSSACAPRHAPSVTETALRYSPARIASGVPAKPGSMTWSPDGRRLAFIGKKLTVYDAGSGEQKFFSIDNPYYAAWAPDNTLYVLSRDKTGKEVLRSLDGINFTIKPIPLDADADAIYPVAGGKGLIILSTTMKSHSFGTTISNTVVLRNVPANGSKTVYRSVRTYMLKNPDVASWTAWMHAGLSPLDDAMLIMEHVKPPDVAFFTKVNSIDLATGEISEMSDPNTKRTYLSASWSPDGRRAVMTDGSGRIEVRDRLGKGIVIDSSRAGIYPSWNPGGSRIYSGGCLIDSDGKNKEALLANAAGSISQWSPDGATLAVATGDELLLFRNILPTYVLPDRPLDKALSEKLSLLKDLLTEGVISPPEYKERRDNLIIKSEEGK